MTSRTVRACESILKSLVKDYGPTAIVGVPLVKKAVILNAGGDPRTVERYMQQMIFLDYLKVQSKRDQTYSLNWRKLDFAQLSLQETLIMEEDEPP